MIQVFHYGNIMKQIINSAKSKNYGVIKHLISSINLDEQSKNIIPVSHQEYHKKEVGEEHYKLLAYISKIFSEKTLFDIGTYLGNSSLALAYNSSTKVISYDIANYRAINQLPDNVEYKIGDFRNDPKLLQSPFILIDVDPHDGIQEQAFHTFFLENNYKGIVMWDDINLQYMRPWWNSITNVYKYDITPIGHHSGTGLIVY